MTLTVRDCRDDDVPAITAIYGHWVIHGLASFELEPPTIGEMTGRRQSLLAQGYPYLVAEADDGGIAGYAYAGPFRTRPAFRFTVEDSIYVAPDMMRQGVAQALLAALLRRCEDAGHRVMVAVIGDSGNAGSIALHSRLGFSWTGVLPAVGWKHDRWVDSVLMTRMLGLGATTPPV